MKNLLFLVCFVAFSYSALAQKTYTINNETLELKTEVEGTLDLLWNIIDGKFRYFVRVENGEILELKNTKKNGKGRYQSEYKSVLSTLTNNSAPTKKVDLTLSSLKSFIDSYNGSQDSTYAKSERTKLQSRLGLFGGLTNNPFVENIDNKSTPFFGLEFEVFEANRMPRHAGFLSLRHAVKHSDFDYAATQIAIGYRYRFINQPGFNIYGNLKFVTVTRTVVLDESSTAFDAPLIFGLGSDIKIGENSFITLAYNELFAIFIDNQGNFPIDFAVGYKINL